MRRFLTLMALAALWAGPSRAEDGHDLWLRYAPLEPAALARYAPRLTSLDGGADSLTLAAARAELERGLGGLLGAAPPVAEAPADGAVVFGSPASSPAIAALDLPLQGLGDEGYLIRSAVVGGHPVTVVAANTDRGVLYGAFALLRLIQTRQPIDHLDLASAPKLKVRLLDHWDNLDGSVERGYAGGSIWDWRRLPLYRDPRYTDYARADASIGLNGAVLNNVNASAQSLTPAYLAKAAAIAAALRPYGVKVYLSARWSAPIELDHLPTADPLDPRVAAWWKAKAAEIYRYIPDFGGFLVKANSEGQPGPGDYHRTHAQGANMLAAALAPHHGIVMWRAFVYSQAVPADRAKQAYDEFKPLDGQFADNVLVQVKNGAIDFQPREPFHPLFGAMPDTALMLELQVTREYLGQGTGVVYLGPLYEEALRSDTLQDGPGSTVAKVIEGRLSARPQVRALTGVAGVANIGMARNWTGTAFDQANWYVFGRMAWDPEVSARAVAQDWLKMTFTADPRFVTPMTDMMMGSREAAVDYMVPLGLAHQMAESTHYGPGPWVSGASRPDWNSTFYSKVAADGIGFDRTATGSDAVAQYAPPAAALFSDPKTTPQDELLWFHHLAWDYAMPSGRSLWDELVVHYDQGIAKVEGMQATWATMKPYVDPQRFEAVSAMLATQRLEAQWWRDGCIAYYQTYSHRPTPPGHAEPRHPASYYEAITSPFQPDF